MDNPRLVANDFTLPLHELVRDLYSSLLNFNDGSDAPELIMQATDDANLWHRWLGHLNRKILDLLKIRTTMEGASTGPSHIVTSIP